VCDITISIKFIKTIYWMQFCEKLFFLIGLYSADFFFFLYESLLTPYAIIKKREKEKEREKERDACKILLNKII